MEVSYSKNLEGKFKNERTIRKYYSHIYKQLINLLSILETAKNLSEVP